MTFRTDDGKAWRFQPGSSQQLSWVDLMVGDARLGQVRAPQLAEFCRCVVTPVCAQRPRRGAAAADRHHRIGALVGRTDPALARQPSGHATTRGGLPSSAHGQALRRESLRHAARPALPARRRARLPGEPRRAHLHARTRGSDRRGKQAEPQAAVLASSSSTLPFAIGNHDGAVLQRRKKALHMGLRRACEEAACSRRRASFGPSRS